MDIKEHIPETTIETLARNFFKEASSYGFKQDDYLRYINTLLDFSMSHKNKINANVEAEDAGKKESADFQPASLPLKGERVLIRAFDHSKDAALLANWVADEFGRYFLLSRTSSKELDIEQLTLSDDNIIGVITSPDEKPIGVMAFLDFDANLGKAELRKLIGEPNMRGKGLGKEATSLWIQYGIRGLELRKIYLNTLNTNIRNIKLNEELGFKVEGILRNEALIDGKYHDVLRLGLWNGMIEEMKK